MHSASCIMHYALCMIKKKEDKLKNEDDLKNEDLKNENALKNEDDLEY